MGLNNPFVFIYVGIFLLALLLAVWRRNTFPLTETLLVTLIVGVGFTSLIYFIAPHPANHPAGQVVPFSELVFTVAYLIITAALLIRGAPMPKAWKTHFIKKSLASLAFKLIVFILIPLAALRLIWHTGWADLGFARGNLTGQLAAAGILMVVFGGFNLFAGGAAAPIRKRQYTPLQVAGGMLLAFVWNLLETGLVEEFYFRAFLQGRFTAYLGSAAAGICIASLLFGLAHAPGIFLRRGERHGPLGERPRLLETILYAILGLSPTGWFTGLLYWRCQSLLAPVLVHAAVDAVAHTAEFLEGLGVKKRISSHDANQ